MIHLQNVTRHYRDGAGVQVAALTDVTLHIAPGTFTGITGPSGCGKSTLLHILGALDSPTSGTVTVADVPLHSADDRARTHYRRATAGIVFQFFHLLPSMTLLENVAMPLILAGSSESAAHTRAAELLSLAGLTARAQRLPHEVSGGELQRAAVARALVHRPRLLLADEPTGNLDSANARNVMDLLHTVHTEGTTTLVMVTHSDTVAAQLPACIRMKDGRIESQR